MGKYLCLSSCIFLACLSPLHAQHTSVKDVVLANEKKFSDLQIQRKCDDAAQLLTVDMRGISVGIGTKADFLTFCKSDEDIPTREIFSHVEFALLAPDTALVTYRDEASFLAEGKPISLQALVASVWVKHDSKWLLALHTATSVPFAITNQGKIRLLYPDSDEPAQISEPALADLKSNSLTVTSPNDLWSPPKASVAPTDLEWLIGNWRVERHYHANLFMQGKNLTETMQCAWAVGGYHVICNSQDILDNAKPVREVVVWSQDVELHVLRFVDISPDDPTDQPPAGWCRIDGDMWYCYSEPRLENGKTIHLRFVTKNTPSSANGNSQFSEDGTKWLPLSDDSWTKVR